MSTSAVSVFLDSLVHASPARDRFSALRHLAFIVSGAGVGTLAIAAMFATLAWGAPRPFLEVGLLALLAGELGIAAYLSRTGNIDIAQIASALLLTAVVAGLAASTGGARSPVLVWIAFVPLDASLAGSRRALLAAAAIAGIGLAGLFAVGNLLAGEAKAFPHDFAAFPTMMAVLMGGALALRMGWVVAGIGRLARGQDWLPVPAEVPVTRISEPDLRTQPMRSADVTTLVPRERQRSDRHAPPAAIFDEAKELRRA